MRKFPRSFLLLPLRPVKECRVLEYPGVETLILQAAREIKHIPKEKPGIL